MPSPGPCTPTPPSTSSWSPRATPGSSPSCAARSTLPRPPPSRTSPRGSGPTSWWSAPRGPLVAGAADAVRDRGDRLLRSVRRGRAAWRAARRSPRSDGRRRGADGDGPPLHLPSREVTDALESFGPPFVVKDDGLAAGKGVVVTSDEQAAVEHGAACLARPGGRVVVEQYLEGPEVSLFCVTDGRDVVPLAPAAGLQAGGGRRHRAEHGRDGRLLAAALGAAATGGGRRRAGRRPVVAELARAWHPLQRAALLRARADGCRRPGDRVQRTVRGPGDAGGARAARDAAQRRADGRGHRPAARAGSAALAGPGRRHRRRRCRGVPGRAGAR